jgi:predicted ATPase
MLIVLDNFEHLTNDASPLVSALLAACQNLKILITSREALRVEGEWQYPVPPLDIPDALSVLDINALARSPAVSLFVERARAVQPDFAVNKNNIEAITAICARLDGLPLAIELIAARIRLLSPQMLLTKLNSQFILYTDGMRDRSLRQKTLHGAIEWSYRLLSAEEQQFFAGLSVFSGGFTLQAAETIFSQSASDLIASLLDKSILQRSPHESDGPRFKILLTIQQFAREQLRNLGGETQARDLHLGYFLTLAEQVDQEIHGPAQVEAIRRLELEQDNFWNALDWGISHKQTELFLRLLNALSWGWLVRSHFNEIQNWFEKIRSQSEIHSYPDLYARLLNFMGRVRWLLGDFFQARAFLKESQEIWLELGSSGTNGLAECLDFLGLVTRSMEREDPEKARSLFQESLNLYEIQGDLRGKAFTYFLLGMLSVHQDRSTAALAELGKSMDLFRQIGDVWGIARVSEHLGKCFFEQGDYEKALSYYEQQLRLDEELSFKPAIVLALIHLGDLYRYQGVYDQAQLFYERVIWMCREYDVKSDRGYHLYALGMLALHQRDFVLAKKFFHDYYISSREFADLTVTHAFLTGLAAITAATNEPERAARLSGAAKAISQIIVNPIPAFDQAELDRFIQIAHQQLGETTFQAFQAEGLAMSQTQAIDYALDLPNS